MERVLVLSDDARWRDALVADLAAAGHQARGLVANAFDNEPPDLSSPQSIIVIDARGQPGPKGRLSRIRRGLDGAKAYLLLALAPAQVARLDLSAGFDDFVIEPPAADEIVARARQIRWRENTTDTADLLKAGDLVVNLASCEVLLQGNALSLTYQEYELLRYLLEHRGRVFTREQLLSELWGYNYYGGTRTVDVHVRRLRAKLGPEHEDLIQTVRNVGYRFARESA